MDREVNMQRTRTGQISLIQLMPTMSQRRTHAFSVIHKGVPLWFRLRASTTIGRSDIKLAADYRIFGSWKNTDLVLLTSTISRMERRTRTGCREMISCKVSC